MTGREVPQDKMEAPLPEIEGVTQESPEKRHSQWASRAATTNGGSGVVAHAEGGGEQPLGPEFTGPIISINS